MTTKLQVRRGVSKVVDRLAVPLFNAALSRDERRRLEGRYAIVNLLASRWGFRTYNLHLNWYRDSPPLEAWRQFAGGRPMKDRHYVLYSMARALSGLQGDTAECGVYDGAGSYLICLANESKVGHLHHAFDSFEGLSPPGTLDLPGDSRSFRWKVGDLAVPLAVAQRNLARFGFVRYHQGWIPQRFNDVSERPFSFVHIDVDLYQPTLDSLAFFYPRLVPGGMIVCDDYGFATCPGAKLAFDTFIKERPEQSVIELTSGQGFIVKR